MKTISIAMMAATLILAPSPVWAADPAVQTQAAAKHYSTQETSIAALLADPAVTSIVDKHILGLSANPQISLAGAMKLYQISQMAPDQIKPAMLAAIDADLAKIPAK